jgi:hypothetical protein
MSMARSGSAKPKTPLIISPYYPSNINDAEDI